MILRISEDCYFWFVGSMPDVNIPKWSSSIVFFRGKYEIWKKSIYEHFFRTRKSKNSVFWGSTGQLEILEKMRNITNRFVEVGQVVETTPNLFFRSWGGICGQNELYTSPVRSFSKKLYFCEVGSFLADFLEISLWSICGSVISREKNIIF